MEQECSNLYHLKIKKVVQMRTDTSFVDGVMRVSGQDEKLMGLLLDLLVVISCMGCFGLSKSVPIPNQKSWPNEDQYIFCRWCHACQQLR